MARNSRKSRHKYIFVVGGVMSGVGKGIAASSIGTLLSAKGFRVNLVKVDPYLNVDAGTMNPTEHGEVFVLNSGLETDQDMGNYERFLGRDSSADNYITSGMVYKHVIEKERALEYGGRCVEALPHVRNEIIERFQRAVTASKSDISVIEIGGTVGDFQNALFIEAARVMRLRHPGDVVFVMVSYLPVPGTIGEMKTKPTQHALSTLNSYGVQADFIIARSSYDIDEKRKEKLSLICNVKPERIVSAPDIKSIYDVPVNFDKGHLGETLLEALGLPVSKNDDSFKAWKKMAAGIKNHHQHEVNIGIVGKYFNTGDFILSDSYISVLEAIKFSSYAVNVKPIIHTVNARDFEGEVSTVEFEGEVSTGEAATSVDFGAAKRSQTKTLHRAEEGETLPFAVLDEFDGIIVPGGFGESGIEGKLNVIRYARENNIPCFGLCYGMQLMIVEFARNVLGLKRAHTAEIDPKSPHPVIDIMPDQKKKLADSDYGGTMRLGSYPAKLLKGSIANEAYWRALEGDKGEKGNRRAKKKREEPKTPPSIAIRERHRHRYEVNPKYIEKLEKGGLVFSGKSPDLRLMEIAELPRDQHPFFLGTQFHPEFMARPLRPHPLFTEFIKSAKRKNQNKSL
jgi:CTP synthase